MVAALDPRAVAARVVPRRLGLRLRITFGFAIGAFALSALFAGITYVLTRSALIRQRDSAAVALAYRDAATVGPTLVADNQAITRKLQDLGVLGPMAWVRDQWVISSASYTGDNIPRALRDQVINDGQPARMIFNLRGSAVIAVGIPIPSPVATQRLAYFEITPLKEVGATLRSVGAALLGASAMTTSMGVLLGRWAANRAVRPLSDAARAAKAIAGGRLDTRLEPDDDTGLKELSEAFNDMASALQQRIERDARFASDVSHELRSPLMTLSASIEVMNARRDEMPERAVAALDLLSADVVRFQGLVEDLLEISRFDAGAIRLHREDQFVAEFVRQAVAVSSVPDAPIAISEIGEEMVVRVDKRRMARALANLLDNARVYGAAPISVAVGEPPSERGGPPAHVLIAVEDRGIGVALEERNLVFERFARGTGARRRGLGEGAGLGLALVDEHVRLHGGRVWVEDRLDGEAGARFVIELPLESE